MLAVLVGVDPEGLDAEVLAHLAHHARPVVQVDQGGHRAQPVQQGELEGEAETETCSDGGFHLSSLAYHTDDQNHHESSKNRIKLAELDWKVQIHPWQREGEGDGREERVEEVVDELAAGVAHLRGRIGGQYHEISEGVTDKTVTHFR